jgi:formiminoglutamase
VLLSIPHGGLSVPEELHGRVCISKADLFDDIDPFAREIYDIGGRAVAVISTDIARTFVDVNRAANDLPPANTDGVIKSMTCFHKPIYLEEQEPDEEVTAKLLRGYYEPYHERIRGALQHNEIELALDCHTMLAVDPPTFGAPGKTRRALCLGNADGKTCSMEMIERLSQCFCKAFSLPEREVSLNQPFSGGHITRTYGGQQIPWVQVEINRAQYLAPPWSDSESLFIDPSRLEELNQRFEKTLSYFFKS